MIFLSVIFILLLLFYLSFIGKIYFGLKNIKSGSSDIPGEQITVIIPFRNEEENILKVLNSIECQDYPLDKYEVLFINDHSEDKGAVLLGSNIKSKNVKVLPLPLHVPGGKKNAIEYGIVNSTGEIIVTTDADCTLKPTWLRTLLGCFNNNTALVSGTVSLNESNNIFNKLQQLEFASLITAGAGLIGAGDPYICNGANLAYRKEVFNKVNGFVGKHKLASGDDELLLHKIAGLKSYSIKFCSHQNAAVHTSGASNLKEFYYQRKRWGSKGLFYSSPKKIITLIIIFMFYFSLLIQPLLTSVDTIFLRTFLISLVLKILSEYFVMRKAAGIIYDRSLIRYFFPAQLLQVPYIVFAAAAGTLGGLKWKNRKLSR